MTWFRVIQDFEYKDQRGIAQTAAPGELVDIMTQHEANVLMARGYICPPEYSWEQAHLVGNPAHKFAKTKRIAIWLATTKHYSGGRIHMFQYASAMAQAGAEVFLVTNAYPKWAEDYPKNDRLHVIIRGKNPIPPDIDLIITDSKAEIGIRAAMWKRQHPRIPFFAMNFETPNWVAEYDKKYSESLRVPKGVFEKADILLANSPLSAKYLLEWLKMPNKQCHVLPPVANTYALEKIEKTADRNLPDLPSRPYAIWSARSPAYKGGRVALEAVWDLKVPLDMALFGHVNDPPRDNSLHRLYRYEGRNDLAKFYLMKHAQIILAPSKFEGYGMVPGEALCSGTPCLVYDLPVLREAYGERLIYAKWGDKRDFKKKLTEAVTKGVRGIQNPNGDTPKLRKKYGLQAMKRRVESLPHHRMSKPSVSVQLISYWGFVPEALESVYPHVDQILVAFGRVEKAQKIDDGSLERLQAFPDPDGKITMKIKDTWKDKREMREWCCRRVEGNYQLLLDGDEIWVGLDKWIQAEIPFGCPRWLNLWHGTEHWIYDTAKLAGTRWGRKLDPYGSTCPHYRWSWWRPSYYFKRHPLPRDAADNPLHIRDGLAATQVPECVIYHLGHALPKEIMARKHQFYLDRDGANEGRKNRRRVWEKWNGKTGDIGDGIVQKVNWKLPEIVTRAMKGVNEHCSCNPNV